MGRRRNEDRIGWGAGPSEKPEGNDASQEDMGWDRDEEGTQKGYPLLGLGTGATEQA